MENPIVSGLRSRSRSKTPFLRSSCDRENCTEGEEHTHVSGRKTPVRRSSQSKQSKQPSNKAESIQEEDERGPSPPAHRTRQATRTSEKVVKTSDYSSDENVAQYKEDMFQSTQYDVAGYKQRLETFADVNLSPIHHVLTQQRRSPRPVSPAYSSNSTCSSSSTFAQQALADSSVLLSQDPTLQHLPYRLYKMAGEYWNKYPKTDYTYSSLSKDRVELAPGQIAVPNMSRPSLSQARLQRSTMSVDEIDDRATSTTRTYDYLLRNRRQAAEFSDDDSFKGNGSFRAHERKRWWNCVGSPYNRYPYTDRRSEGIFKRAAKSTGAFFYWIYTVTTTVVTTTVSTITETVSPSRLIEKYNSYSEARSRSKQSDKPWSKWLLLLLLLPLVGYGCYNQGILPTATTLPHQEHYVVNPSSNQDMEIISHLVRRVENLEKQQNDLKSIEDKIKSMFGSQYATKDELNTLSQGFSRNEERMRQLTEEYVRVHMKEMTVRREGCGGCDEEAIKKLVSKMLEIYDADKVGMVDYAMESAGGQVISTKCTELYQIKTMQYSVLGIPVWWVYTSPRHALAPGSMPAQCWAFQGFPGYLVIKTFATIEVTGFTIEHMSRLLAADGKIESAPKNFSVYGLLDETDQSPHHFGDYIYQAEGPSIQYFPVQKQSTMSIAGRDIPVAYDIIELRIESNHGNPTYTCLYRFRVHGNPMDKIIKSS